MADPAAATHIDAERKSLKSYNMPYTVFNVIDEATAARVQGIPDSVKGMEKPVLIHTFRSDQPVAKLFMQVYRNQP